MDLESIYRQAQELEGAGHHGRAASVYKQLVSLAADARFHIAYGRCLQSLGHWEESVEQLRRGVDLKPHYCEGDARLMLAASLLEIGQKKNAIAQWRVVAAMKPEYPSYEAVPNAARELLFKHDA